MKVELITEVNTNPTAMYTVPKFEVIDSDEVPEGVFDWGNRAELYEGYYDAADHFDLGEIDEARSILEEILQKDPHFMEAHQLLGDIELDWGSRNKAAEHHKKALEVGEQVVPDSFDGNIRWGFTENRPFLRALYSVAMHHLDDRQFDRCIPLLERLLEYNPDDNQGIRYLIGDLYLIRDHPKKAEAIYRDNLDYPPYLYSYGLLLFQKKKYARALTSLRKGILSNIYISDFLRTKLPLIPYEIWHSSNFEMPETAYSYVDLTISVWIKEPEVLDLLQFLHLFEPSRSEIEHMYMLKNDLYVINSGLDPFAMEEGEQAMTIRDEILNEIEDIVEGITDASSRKLYKNWNENPLDQHFSPLT